MTQVRRNKDFAAALGRRLHVLIEEHLGLAWNDVALRLGYATTTTLRQAARGRTSLSAEKLAALARLTTSDETRRVSVDWLLTGTGQPLLKANEVGSGNFSSELPLEAKVAGASRQSRRLIAAFLEASNKQ